MSIQSIGAPRTSDLQNSVQAVAQQLATAVDANHDGQITTDEFVQFLTQFLSEGSAKVDGGSQSGINPLPPSGGGEGGLPGPNPLPPQAVGANGTTGDSQQWINPAVWNSNNVPYGFTFAGFSPQDHTNLSLTDLSDLKNAKYAVYDYLLSNKVAPGNNWAPAAADALNQLTNSNVFKAVDGETLVYGDEYVHSAPNGYGMLPGTYAANAKGEFFWGYTDAA